MKDELDSLKVSDPCWGWHFPLYFQSSFVFIITIIKALFHLSYLPFYSYWPVIIIMITINLKVSSHLLVFLVYHPF